MFRDLFENRQQFRYFQNYLTALIVLDNKTMANMSRYILDSADKTNLSRFFSEAAWFREEVNTRRIEYLLEQTEVQRVSATDSCLINKYIVLTVSPACPVLDVRPWTFTRFRAIVFLKHDLEGS